MPIFAFVCNYQENPACHYQKYGYVAIIDEEARLTSSLKPPIHSISTKEGSSINFHSISDLILNSWLNKSFSLIRYFLIRRYIVVNKNSKKPDSFIHVLTHDMI